MAQTYKVIIEFTEDDSASAEAFERAVNKILSKEN